MGTLINPITGEVSYTDNNGSPTSGDNKGKSTITTRDSQATPQNTATSNVSDQVVEYIEGTIGLLPNPSYSAKKVFNIQGVGAVFNGDYYFKTVRHTISGDNYVVEADVTKMGNVSFSTFSSTSTNNAEVDRVEPAPQPQPTAPANPGYIMHHIVRGDTLWGLARKYYGNGALYPRIFNANRDTVSNPNLIYDGKWLRIPQ